MSIRYGHEIVDVTPGTKGRRPIATRAERPYSVFGAGLDGLVYQTEYRKNWFSKYDYHQIESGDCIWKMYPIGFGHDGIKNPVYAQERQCGLIEQDNEVFNDLHVYKLTCSDDYAVRICLVFAMYMYVNTAFKPGVLVQSSYERSYEKTINKQLLEKYDASFKQRLIDGS